MQSVSVESLEGVASLLADNESLRAQIERMSAELKACRECASHFKWVIKRQCQQLQRLRKPQ